MLFNTLELLNNADLLKAMMMFTFQTLKIPIIISRLNQKVIGQKKIKIFLSTNKVKRSLLVPSNG